MAKWPFLSVGILCDIIKWETIVTVMLSNSKAHKYFAKTVEVVLMVIEFKKLEPLLRSYYSYCILNTCEKVKASIDLCGD